MTVFYGLWEGQPLHCIHERGEEEGSEPPITKQTCELFPSARVMGNTVHCDCSASERESHSEIDTVDNILNLELNTRGAFQLRTLPGRGRWYRSSPSWHPPDPLTGVGTEGQAREMRGKRGGARCLHLMRAGGCTEQKKNARSR